LLEFYIYAQYQYHDDATLSHMEHAWDCFYTFNDVSLLGRANKQANATAKALIQERKRKRKVDAERNATIRMPCKVGREATTWWDYISHAMEMS
jgi:hypothetical protein